MLVQVGKYSAHTFFCINTYYTILEACAYSFPVIIYLKDDLKYTLHARKHAESVRTQF